MNKAKHEEALRKLKNKFQATIGTHGSNRGCTIDIACREFKKDWNENLYDYVRSLRYKDLKQLLNSMSSHVRLEGQKVYAVNNENLQHCFDLIDRTPAARPRRRFPPALPRSTPQFCSLPKINPSKLPSIIIKKPSIILKKENVIKTLDTHTTLSKKNPAFTLSKDTLGFSNKFSSYGKPQLKKVLSNDPLVNVSNVKVGDNSFDVETISSDSTSYYSLPNSDDEGL